MTDEFFLNGEALRFIPGPPAMYSELILPDASVKHATGQWGSICIQEIRDEHFLLRHFLFKLNQVIKIISKERGEGLQSLIALKGELEYSVKGLPKILFKESQFQLLNAHAHDAIISISTGKPCSLVNAYYDKSVFEGLLKYFPRFKTELKKARKKPILFSTGTKIIRYSIHDAIQDIWLDRYLPVLQHKYIELQLERSLFSLLADAYSPPMQDKASAREKEKAGAARDLMLTNIRKHLTTDAIALEVNCSTSWLKKAFSKVYGMGPFHYLREYRMRKAKEMLLQGESLKAVAIEVGMKPRNFPKEFKSFFGYTVTELKKGLYK